LRKRIHTVYPPGTGVVPRGVTYFPFQEYVRREEEVVMVVFILLFPHLSPAIRPPHPRFSTWQMYCIAAI